MIKNLKFEPQLETLLQETYTLLKSANLIVHESVSSITLHGSRGLKGGARTTSDIDSSLIVDSMMLSSQSDREALLRDILGITLNHWQSHIELDLAVVFDIRDCGLKCFNQTTWDAHLCRQRGVDCFGLYRAQKGFMALVINAGVQVILMYPCLKIWERL